MRKNALFCALCMVLITTQHLSAADYVTKIITGVVKADSWTEETASAGIYRLEVKDTPTLTQLSEGNDVLIAPLGGAVYVDGQMQGIHFKTTYDPYTSGNTYTIFHVGYDMQDWTQTKKYAMDNLYANLISSCGLAHDPETGLNYGIFYNFNMDMQVINRKLATIDFSTDKPTKSNIDVVETPFAAIAIGPDGWLYGVGQDGYLYIIEKTDATLYPLGDLGLEDISTYPASMTFDPRTGKLYFSYVTTGMKSVLYEVDYTIGSVSATKLMDVPDNAFLVNMYIEPTTEGAPQAATALQLNFEGEKTTGSVAFTMPTMTQDDEELEGELTYVVQANGVEIANGQAQPGEEVSCEVTVPESGDTEMSIIVKNDKGESPAVKATQYIGRDVPLAVSNLKLTYNPVTGNAELHWDAPTEGTHGKTLTQANLTYNIVRQPGDVEVATGLAETTFREALDNTGELTSYSYEVAAVNGDMEGEKCTSNAIVLGDALEVPFFEDFQQEEGFNRFTAIDANGDGTYNKYTGYKAQWFRFYKYYPYSGSTVYGAAIVAGAEPDDDWLLSPAIRLENGNHYALSFEANKSYASSNYNQKMEVWYGQGDDPTTFTQLGTYDIDDVNLTLFEEEIIPEADGLYRIAFHAVSNANSDQLLLTNIKLVFLMNGSAPVAATDMTITPDALGALTATVTLTAPATDIQGNPLTEITRIDVLDAAKNVVGTTAEATPGEPCTIECSGLSNGYNTLTAIAYVGEVSGEKTSAEAYVGVDRPTAPQNVRLCDDGEHAYLTWEAPSVVGYYGHYVNPDALTYNLYNIASDGYADLYRENITQPYQTDVATNEGDQHLLYYALDAQSLAGKSPLVATNSLVVGEAYPLPFQETFVSGFHTNQFVWFIGEDFARNFKLSSNSADGDEAALVFEPNYSSYGIFNTGKIALTGAEKPQLSFCYYGDAGEQMSLIVSVDRLPQGEWQQVAAIDFAQESETAWKEVTVPLTDFMDSPYILLRFEMASLSANYTSLLIDNIQVGEEVATGINDVATPGRQSSNNVYTLDGRLIRHHADAASQMPKGIYLVNGRKVVVR